MRIPRYRKLRSHIHIEVDERSFCVALPGYGRFCAKMQARAPNVFNSFYCFEPLSFPAFRQSEKGHLQMALGYSINQNGPLTYVAFASLNTAKPTLRPIPAIQTILGDYAWTIWAQFSKYLETLLLLSSAMDSVRLRRECWPGHRIYLPGRSCGRPSGKP